MLYFVKWRLTAPNSGSLDWLHFGDGESHPAGGKIWLGAWVCGIYRSVDDADL
jgi:hypothetical protein